MKNLIPFLLLFTGSILLRSQDFLVNMVLDRNVAVPGQDIYYLLDADSTLINDEGQYPQVNVFLRETNGNLLIRNSYRPNGNITHGKLTIPAETQPGNYVFSVSILDEGLNHVLIENSTLIYVVASGGRGEYFTAQPVSTFEHLGKQLSLRKLEETCASSGEKAQNETAKSGWCTTVYGDLSNNALMYFTELRQENAEVKKEIHTREEVCIKDFSSANDIILISSSSNFYNYFNIYFQSFDNNFQYTAGLPYAIAPEVKLPGFFHNEAGRFYPLKRNNRPGVYVVKAPEIFGNQSNQIIDLISNKIIDQVKESWPDALWMKNLQFSKDQSPQNNFEQLFAENEKSSLVDNILHSRIIHPIKKTRPVKSEKIASDVIKLSLFQPFESMELFIVEALPQMRMLSRKKEGNVIRLMNLDSRSLYEEAPSLLINGVLQESSEEILSIPYNEIDSISIYRQLELTRRNLGSLARNGVIEIHTKPGYDLKKTPGEFSIFSEEEQFPFNNYKYENGDTKAYFNPTVFIGSSAEFNGCVQHNDHGGKFLIQARHNGKIETFYYNVSVQFAD